MDTDISSFFTSCRSWKIVTPGAHTRHINGILGLLIREHFPGFVRVGTGEDARFEPAYTWEHYKRAPDSLDRNNRCYDSVADRVKAELWVSLPPSTQLNSSFLNIH